MTQISVPNLTEPGQSPATLVAMGEIEQTLQRLSATIWGTTKLASDVTVPVGQNFTPPFPDPGPDYEVRGGNGRLVAPADGLYLLSTTLYLKDCNDTHLYCTMNATHGQVLQDHMVGVPAGAFLTMTGITPLAAGEDVWIHLFTSGPSTLSPTYQGCSLALAKL